MRFLLWSLIPSASFLGGALATGTPEALWIAALGGLLAPSG
ncbi:hypothetical protein GCM10010171_57200 [Actinokineospora fastidiosa]|uniref:Uncharacterized protein n=1 Tax=Actinokineospora fastidiosa TaxID=1816 RepID=A0A918GS52_9PSEU|nr:hypothetical protein GCM10010171_57200 [Actinokineospora fastidiosa]